MKLGEKCLLLVALAVSWNVVGWPLWGLIVLIFFSWFLDGFEEGWKEHKRIEEQVVQEIDSEHTDA